MPQLGLGVQLARVAVAQEPPLAGVNQAGPAREDGIGPQEALVVGEDVGQERMPPAGGGKREEVPALELADGSLEALFVGEDEGPSLVVEGAGRGQDAHALHHATGTGAHLVAASFGKAQGDLGLSRLGSLEEDVDGARVCVGSVENGGGTMEDLDAPPLLAG